MRNSWTRIYTNFQLMGSRCKAITSVGKRCKGKKKKGSIYCYNHRNYIPKRFDFIKRWLTLWNFGTALAIIGIIIPLLISAINNRKFGPAKEAVVWSLAKTHTSVFSAASQVMDFNYSSSYGVKGKSFYLKKAAEDFKSLQKDTQLNNSALDPDLMSLVSTYLKQAESLIKKLGFFVLLHDDDKLHYDFVAKPPFEELDKLEQLTNKISANYAHIFSDKRLSYYHIKTAHEIINVWKKVEKNSGRLCFNPSSYHARNGKIAFFYNLSDLKALPSANIQNGAGALVYKSDFF